MEQQQLQRQEAPPQHDLIFAGEPEEEQEQEQEDAAAAEGLRGRQSRQRQYNSPNTVLTGTTTAAATTTTAHSSNYHTITIIPVPSDGGKDEIDVAATTSTSISNGISHTNGSSSTASIYSGSAAIEAEAAGSGTESSTTTTTSHGKDTHKEEEKDEKEKEEEVIIAAAADPLYGISSVYLDQNDGMGASDEVSETRQSSSTCFVPDTSFSSKDNPERSSNVQESMIGDTNNQDEGNLNSGGFSGSSLAPLQGPFQEQSVKSDSFDCQTNEVGNCNIIEEIDQEVTEFDVEGVLEKQTTHDLFCPNCNSCITRRVILRRRKRKIWNARRKPKSETSFQSDLDANPTSLANDLVHDAADISLIGNYTPAANNSNHERELDIFRCLSCFSFFIPTGNGFKLFRIFGDQAENENIQSPQRNTTRNTNWFSIFATDRRKTTTEQGNHVACHSEINGMNQDNIFGYSEHMQPQHIINYNATIPDASTTRISAETAAKDAHVKHQQDAFGSQGPSALEDLLLKKPQVGAVNDLNLTDGKEMLADEDGLVSSFTSIPVREDEKDAVYSSREYQGHSENGITFLGKKLEDVSETANEGGFTGIDSEKAGKDALCLLTGATAIPEEVNTIVGKDAEVQLESKIAGDSVIVTVETETLESMASQGPQNIDVSIEDRSRMEVLTVTPMGERRADEVNEAYGLDILKSIVYGGLIESIASLGIVSSAAGAGAATLNILALGLANLIGGLFIIIHNLIDLKNERGGGASTEMSEQEDRYQELLGRRRNFALHVTVAILSFLIFGLLPPVIYGISFRESDDRDLKLAAAGGACLACIILLAIGKAHVRRLPRSYIRTVLYYVIMGITASGASYIAGNLIDKLLEKIGWSDSSSALAMSTTNIKPTGLAVAWASSD